MTNVDNASALQEGAVYGRSLSDDAEAPSILSFEAERPAEPISFSKAKRRSLTDGPVARTLFLFALPLLTTNILQSLSASVNTVWVSHALGEVALAATFNANLVLFFLLGAVFGVSMASNILVAQAIGGERLPDAKKAIGTSVGFFTLLSVVVAAFGYVFSRQILVLIGTPADALGLATTYLKVIFVAMPFLYSFTFVTMVLRGAGDAGTPFVFMGLSVVLDALFNPLLIWGIGPFPKMGIAGAATSTLVSQLVSLSAMMVWLYARKHFLRLKADELGYLRPDPAILKALVYKGLPMGLQMVVISTSALVMISVVNKYGSKASAAYGVMAQLWTYVQMPALAIAAGASSMAAQAVGANLWPRVREVARAGVAINVLLTGGLIVAALILDPMIMGVYLPAGDSARALADHINVTTTWSFVLFGVTYVLFGVVRSTGAVLAPLMILIVALLVVRAPFAWLLSPRYGLDMVWWSFPVGTGVAAALATAYYRWGGWRKARMLGDAAGHGQDSGHDPEGAFG